MWSTPTEPTHREDCLRPAAVATHDALRSTCVHKWRRRSKVWLGSGTGGRSGARRLAHTLPTCARREFGLAGVGEVAEEVAVAGRLGRGVRLRAGPTGLELFLELGDDIDAAVELAYDLIEWHRAAFGLIVEPARRVSVGVVRRAAACRLYVGRICAHSSHTPQGRPCRVIRIVGRPAS